MTTKKELTLEQIKVELEKTRRKIRRLAVVAIGEIIILFVILFLLTR